VKKTFIAFASLTLIATSAAAEADPMNASGASALALAALIGSHSPVLKGGEKQALSAMLGGDLAFSFPRGATISVSADSVSCRSSSVDISSHACTLKFGAASRALSGREAHELCATLIENGVAAEGAAGSTSEAVSHLSCKIDPDAVKQRNGAGADCAFVAGP
jgi:hypothetical protein